MIFPVAGRHGRISKCFCRRGRISKYFAATGGGMECCMKKSCFALLLALLLSLSCLPVFASEGADAPKKGTLIYEETFEYADEADHKAALAQLGWEEQTKAMGAYQDPTATVAISEGRLMVTGASDTYYLMLTEEDMAAYDGETITIQYDMEYTTAASATRYFCILANYTGQKYNSFHFRNNGSGNNQAHINSSWITYDSYNPATDIYAAAQDTNTGSSIAMKLLGKKYTGNSLFSEVPVTVRYVLDPMEGMKVYMKLAEQTEDQFVLVSALDPTAEGVSHYGSWHANAICVKIGGQQNGYIDNIAVWTGDGNYPQPEPEPEETTVQETEPAEPTEGEDEPTEEVPEEEPKEPEKVKEPQTKVNTLALCAVALFGGWIVYKKGKEQSEKQ